MLMTIKFFHLDFVLTTDKIRNLDMHKFIWLTYLLHPLFVSVLNDYNLYLS